MSKPKKTDSNETPNELTTTPDGNAGPDRTSVWTQLDKLTFAWAGEDKAIIDCNVNALHYLIAYGAKQSSGDTGAARAKLIGQDKAGKVPKDSWSKEDREKTAKELEFSYSDADMKDRETLADLYFAKQNAAKWDRIVKGLLTVGNNGPRLTPEEQALYDVAEFLYDQRIKSDWKSKMEAMRKADVELVEASDAVVRRALVNKYLEAARSKCETELVRRRDAAKDEDDLDGII